MVQLTLNLERLNKFDFIDMKNLVFWENPTSKYDANSLFWEAGKEHYPFKE